jgi:Flp pilus assembly pilin Flp
MLGRVVLGADMSKVWHFLRDDSGATAVEYTILAACIGLALMTLFTNIGNTISGFFTELDAAIR